MAGVGIPLAILAVYAGSWALAALLGFFAVGASLEIYRLAALRGVRPFPLPGAMLSAALILAAAYWPDAALASQVFWTLTILAVIVLFVAATWLRQADDQPLLAVGVTVVGGLLTGGTLAYGLFLRHLPLMAVPGASEALVGTVVLFFPLALTWINDSMAFVVGTKWGRNKLIPAISPKKTVEGALAGFCGSVLAGTVYAGIIFQVWLGLPVSALLGAIGGALVSIAAQLGDLAESHIKREAGVKDSGTMLPGHGGALDRCDALFFSLPVAYWYLFYVLGAAGSVACR